MSSLAGVHLTLNVDPTSKPLNASYFDPRRFALSDMIECGILIRRLSSDAASMEEVAQRLVRFFYEQFRLADTERPAFALVRCFKTHPYSELTEEQRSAAQSMLPSGSVVKPAMKCLTLLATAGMQEEWNRRQSSRGHQAIPLASEAMVLQAPMIARLIQQLGLKIPEVLSPAPEFLVDAEERAFNIFHVADAPGSPYVPVQQEFVLKYGIKSIIGFGGLLPNGDLFAVILFAQVHIPRETAELFSSLALGIKLSMLPFTRGPIFTRNRIGR